MKFFSNYPENKANAKKDDVFVLDDYELIIEKGEERGFYNPH